MKVTDLSYLFESTNNNKELIVDIVNIFLTQTKEFINSLEEFYSDKNWDKLQKTAHKMKPTLAYVGIRSLEESISKIEEFAEEETNLIEIPELIKKIKNTCEKAYLELEVELENLP